MPPRTARLKSKTRLKPRSAKKAANWLRAYGSKERVAWVKTWPCVWCGVHGHTENAHTVNGGKSRKADASTIAPLCGEFANGCHAKYDRHKPPFDTPLARAEVQAYAAVLERAWRAHVGQVHGTPIQRSA